MKVAKRIFVLIFCVYSFTSAAQTPFDKNYDGIAGAVILDSFVISAQQKGFDVAEFIQIVRTDSSFYEAFHQLRKMSFEAQNQMEFFNKKGKRKASYYAITQQQSDGNCRKMEFRQSNSKGDFYDKNGDYNYITAKMYDKVFFTHGQPCISKEPAPENLKGISKYYHELKTFIFQPGERVDVPFVAKKTAIFDDKMIRFYDYKIAREFFEGEKEAYSFTISVKPEYIEKRKGKTLLKFMKTYFKPENFQVLGRNYQIQYGGLVSCDVEMEVKLKKAKSSYYPSLVKYNGAWNIPGKKKEISNFEFKIVSAN